MTAGCRQTSWLQDGRFPHCNRGSLLTSSHNGIDEEQKSQGETRALLNKDNNETQSGIRVVSCLLFSPFFLSLPFNLTSSSPLPNPPEQTHWMTESSWSWLEDACPDNNNTRRTTDHRGRRRSDKMELDQLRNEAEQLKNAIRVRRQTLIQLSCNVGNAGSHSITKVERHRA